MGITTEAVEMCQWVKYLLDKHEELNSHAQDPNKNQMLCPSLTPALEGGRDSGFQGFTAQPVCQNKLKIH